MREPLAPAEIELPASYLRVEPGEKVTTKRVTPMVYTKRWAYAPIGAEAAPELYDLTRDPYAETDVAADHADVCKDLHARLIGFLSDLDAPPGAASVFE